MGTERDVSHQNKLKSVQRSSLANETTNDRLNTSVNDAGTASYDARSAAAAFLKKRIGDIKSQLVMFIRTDSSLKIFQYLPCSFNGKLRNWLNCTVANL
jgi:hypothetical protein